MSNLPPDRGELLPRPFSTDDESRKGAGRGGPERRENGSDRRTSPLLEGLTPDQRRAAGHPAGDLQVIAGAGSGKTTVQTHRVCHLLDAGKEEGITPEHLLVLAYNDKAAGELRERIGKAYEERFGHREGLAGMKIGTFHSIALRLLKEHVPECLSYDVLNEVRQALFIDRYYVQSGMKRLGLRRWRDTPIYVALLRTLRESRIDWTRLADPPAKAAFAEYRALLKRHRHFDYDELLYRLVLEMKADGPLRRALAEVRHVLVDEYQDVNPIQEEFLRALHALGAGLTVVGDDDQNIYAWRGSDPRLMIGFAGRYPGAERVNLDTNFRGTDPLVAVARRFIEANRERLPKALESGSARAFERGDLLCESFPTPEAEARAVAERILELRGAAYEEGDGTRRGLSWSDCALLFRSVRGSAAPFLAALRERGIPYVVTGMTGLMETAEARAAVGLFSFLCGETEVENLRSLWRDADLGLDEEDLDRGVRFLTDHKASMDASPREGKRQDPAPDLQALYLGFLGAVRLRQERVPDRETDRNRGELAYHHLGKVSQAISDYEGIHYRTPPKARLSGLLRFLRYDTPRYYSPGGEDPGHSTPDAVRVSTVHQAKGTEFPAVFLPALQSERFPVPPRRNPLWRFVPRAAVEGAERYDTDLEGERRLFYVALTRAEKYLFCSWSPDPDTRNWYQRASPFFAALTREDAFLTEAAPHDGEKLPPSPRRLLPEVTLSFSELRYWLECPRQFQLRFLHGFNPPLTEAMGYGQSLHDMAAELHLRSRGGEVFREEDYEALAKALIDRHFWTPYASPLTKAGLRRGAEKDLMNYLRDRGRHLRNLEHVETEVEVALPGGMIVHGRIDLIRRTDTGETLICDFKTEERSLEEDVPRVQLQVYALGYRQRYGRAADLIEVYNLSEGMAVRERVEGDRLRETARKVQEAGEQLRSKTLPAHRTWCAACERCDVAGVCRDREKEETPAPDFQKNRASSGESS